MRASQRFSQPSGTVVVPLPDGREVEIPVVQGILKHASPEALTGLLRDPEVARKYALEALRVAPWPVLRLFPRDWLKECLRHARLPEGRLRALEFMLS